MSRTEYYWKMFLIEFRRRRRLICVRIAHKLVRLANWISPYYMDELLNTKPFTADDARRHYMNDPFISNEEYGQLVEEADIADLQREYEAERPPATDEEIERSFDAYR